MEKELQVLQAKYSTKLSNVIKPTFDVMTSLVINSASDKGKVTLPGFNEIQIKVAESTDSILNSIFDIVDQAVKESMRLHIDDADLVDEVYNSSNFKQDISQHLNYLKVQLDMMLSSFTYPGRKVKDSLKSLDALFTGVIYRPISISTACSLILGYHTNHAYNSSLVYRCAREGASTVKLTSVDLPYLEGIYDIRYVPEPAELGVYTYLKENTIKESNIIKLDGIDTQVWSEDDISLKEELLAKVKTIAPEYVAVLEEEVKYLKDISNYFKNKSTSAFTREVELVCGKIYNAELLPPNSPFDLINSKFLIEVKASNSSTDVDDERGHIAKGELVRKYLFATDMFLDEKTEASHKYVLGVYDKLLDMLTVYEQNYLSNKNSGMMFPVALVHNYSRLVWEYVSTNNTNIMAQSVSIPESSLDMLVSKDSLNDTKYFNVVKASKYNIKTGDTVFKLDENSVVEGIVGTQIKSKRSPGRVYYNLPLNDLLTYLVKDSFPLEDLVAKEEPSSKLGTVCVAFCDLHLCNDTRNIPSIFIEFLILSKGDKNSVEKVVSLRESSTTISGKLVYKPIIENLDYVNTVKVVWEGYTESLSYTEMNNTCRLIKVSEPADIAERVNIAIIKDSIKAYTLQEKAKIIFSLKDTLTKLKI